VLAGVEVLLSKTQEWEQVSARATSLSTYMHRLSQYVIRWRKMELQSWPTLLEQERQQCEKKSTKWWPHLYAIINLGIATTSSSSTSTSSTTSSSSSSSTNSTNSTSNDSVVNNQWLWEVEQDVLWHRKTEADDDHNDHNEHNDYLLSLFENMKLFLHMATFGDLNGRLALVLNFSRQCLMETRTTTQLFGYVKSLFYMLVVLVV
jgi:hypothetical protein